MYPPDGLAVQPRQLLSGVAALPLALVYARRRGLTEWQPLAVFAAWEADKAEAMSVLCG